MKKQAIVFCGADEVAGRKYSDNLKSYELSSCVASAFVFNGREMEGQAYIMPDVRGWHKDRIAAAYPDYIQVKSTEPEHAQVFVQRPDSFLRTVTVGRRGRPRMVHTV
jgi:hypothetical protein